LINCFAAVFPDLSEAEIPAASMASVGAWDSLATVTLLAVVEEEFQVGITPDDLAQLVSFELILDFLKSKS
jgi:acyl carrier protein